MQKSLTTLLLLCLLRVFGFSQAKPSAMQEVKDARKAVDDLRNCPPAANDQEKEKYNRSLMRKYLELSELLERAKAEVDTRIQDDSVNKDPVVLAALQDEAAKLTEMQQQLPDELYASMAPQKAPKASSSAPASSASVSSPPGVQTFVETNTNTNTSVSSASGGSADNLVNTPFTRAVVGFDISGASSVDPQSKFFGEFFVNGPLGSPFGLRPAFKRGCETCLRDKDPLDSRLWLWLNPRIGTVAQPETLSSFKTSTAFLKPAISGKPEKIVQSLEFLGGLEYVLMKPRDSFGFGGGDGTTARFGLSAIAGAGAITPLSQSQASPAIFDVTDQVRKVFSIPSSQTHIVFVPKERDRLFRQYYVGLRLRTYFFKPQLTARKQQKDSEGRALLDESGEPLELREPDYNKPEILQDRFPGIIDLAFGQNEYVTGGKFGGGVLKIEGFYPFPFAPAFHIFASVDLALRARATTSNPILLTPTPTQNPPLSITDSTVFLQPVDQPNRDRYRIGIGVDILSLLSKKDNAELKNKVKDLEDRVNELKKQVPTPPLTPRDGSQDTSKPETPHS